MNKKLFGWLFAVIMLVVMLGISLYLGLSGWFFATSFSQGDELVLGNAVEIHIKNNQASTASFAVSGAFLQGEKLPQIISVKNDEEEGEMYVRAKIYTFMQDSSLADISLITNSNWIKAEDGYYYFTDKLLSQGKIGLSSHISVDHLFAGDKKYIVTVVIESLRSNLDEKDIWGVDLEELKTQQILQNS